MPADFGEDVVFLARHAFHCGGEIGMGTILVGAIKRPDAAFEGIPQEAMEIVAAQARLIGLMLDAAGAGAHAQAGDP